MARRSRKSTKTPARSDAFPTPPRLACLAAFAAHASTAAATASLYFFSAWYCSALPPRCIFLQICLWPRRQWSSRQASLQYLTAKRKMILTTCAACAAPLAHTAPRCVRCWTRYCDSTCQQRRRRRTKGRTILVKVPDTHCSKSVLNA